MKKFKLLPICCIFILLLSACSAFNGNSNDKPSKDTVSTVDTDNNEQVKVKSLYPAYRMEIDKKKWGFVDLSGNFQIEPIYDLVYEFTKDGMAIAANTDDDVYEIMLINKEGKTVAGPFYHNYYVPQFDKGYLIINTNDNKSVVFNESGEKVIESQNQIENYGSGMFCFSQGPATDRQYGYMDIKGDIVIPPNFSYCSSFVGDRACVTLKDGKYAIINKKGEILSHHNKFITLVEASEGMEPFINEADGKWGYKNEAGEVVISPKYENPGKFEDGLAIVEYSTGEYEYFYGVIDTKGNFIFKPEFIGINYLGKGLFSACKGESYSLYHNEFFPKAIFDKQGTQLTPYKFFNVEKFTGDYASCSDGKSTFFIDVQGNIVESMPKAEGVGKFEIKEDIIRLDIDDTVSSYYSPDGKTIWKSDDTIKLEDGIEIETLRFRRDYYTNIIYPQIRNLSSKSIEDTINKKLKEEFIGKYENTEEEKPDKTEDNYLETVSINFSVDKNKDLLVVTLKGEYYPIGAAHRSVYDSVYHINLKTGKFFELKDLFKEGANFGKILTSIVSEQRKKDVGILYGPNSGIDPTLKINNDSKFIVSKDCLSIYYFPGEIDAYAVGFVTFDIPYTKLMDIIDVEGELWKSFDKENKEHKIKYFDLTNKKIMDALEKTMDTYQHSLVEAINTKDFGKVEPVLGKDSELYNDQKKLVADLSLQGIEEKLESYYIYAVKYDYENSDYKLYVTENIGIKKPQENFNTKQFNWCYTAKYDEKNNTCTLVKIEEWKLE